MISDLLSEAIVEIKKYRKKNPDWYCYGQIDKDLKNLLKDMTKIRDYLDGKRD